MSNRPRAAEIANMLASRISDLAPLALPEGARCGREWRAGGTGSKSVILNGPKQGVFSDFSAGVSGDALDLVAHFMFSGDKRAALRWSSDWLGLATADAATLRAASNAAARRRAAAERKRAADDAERERCAAGLWFSARPDIRGTIAETYLASRAINLAALPRHPSALRFHPAIWCNERRGEYPALVTGMWRPGSAKPIAAHRTYLADDGGIGRKAPIDHVRKILGAWPGALMPIARGADGRPFAKMRAGEIVAFGEGLEEALSIALAHPDWRVFAVGFVGNFARIRLPVRARVMLCVNNDPIGSPADLAVTKAAPVIAAAGHHLTILRPPQPHKDWNDYLQFSDGKR